MAYDDPAAASCTTSTKSVPVLRMTCSRRLCWWTTKVIFSSADVTPWFCGTHTPKRFRLRGTQHSSSGGVSINRVKRDRRRWNKQNIPAASPFFSTRLLATGLLWASHQKCTLRDARCDSFWFRTGAHRVTCLLYTGTGLRCRASCLHEPEGLYREKVKSGEQIFTN